MFLTTPLSVTNTGKVCQYFNHMWDHVISNIHLFTAACISAVKKLMVLETGTHCKASLNYLCYLQGNSLCLTDSTSSIFDLLSPQSWNRQRGGWKCKAAAADRPQRDVLEIGFSAGRTHFNITFNLLDALCNLSDDTHWFFVWKATTCKGKKA